jgi:hypothetical protein
MWRLRFQHVVVVQRRQESGDVVDIALRPDRTLAGFA